MHKWTFETSDLALAQKLHGLVVHHVGTAPGAMASDPVTAPVVETPSQVFPPNPALVAPPAAPPMPVAPPVAPPITPPAAPAAPVAAPPAAPAHGQAPPGWIIDHVKGAAEAFTKDPSKGGPAAMKAILDQFGAKRITGVDPARWPDLYNALIAPKA